MADDAEKPEGNSQLAVWVPKWLHRWAKASAAGKGMSLERFIVKLLTEAWRQTQPPEPPKDGT